jgi:multidrug efflux pump subunit AcrA (membrane-fusion protein)
MTRNRKIAVGAGAFLIIAIVGMRFWGNATAPAEQVTSGEIRGSIVARAEVVPADGVAHVVAAVAGRVTRVDVRVGDRVTRDQVLAAVEPSEDQSPTDLLGDNEALRSPIDGVVIARNVEPGDALATLVPAPLPLFVVANVDRLELRIEIEERDAHRVRVGQRARIDDAQTEIARLAPRIERRANPLDDVASRARTDVRLAWASLPRGSHWVLGQHVEVRLAEPPRRVATLVPRSTVDVIEGRAILHVRNGVFVSDTPATLGACDDEHVEVHGVPVGAEILVRR